MLISHGQKTIKQEFYPSQLSIPPLEYANLLWFYTTTVMPLLSVSSASFQAFYFYCSFNGHKFPHRYCLFNASRTWPPINDHQGRSCHYWCQSRSGANRIFTPSYAWKNHYSGKRKLVISEIRWRKPSLCLPTSTYLESMSNQLIHHR